MSARAHGLPADVGTYEVYAVYVDSIPTCRWSPITPSTSARSKISHLYRVTDRHLGEVILTSQFDQNEDAVAL